MRPVTTISNHAQDFRPEETSTKNQAQNEKQGHDANSTPMINNNGLNDDVM